jgi:hypothetical protein
MRRFGLQLGRALAVAGLLGSFAATPAFADHDHHKHWKKHHHDYDRDGYYGSHRYYSRDYDYDYDRYYYSSGPRVSVYAPPVYVPPPRPPSFGLSLVFPFH